MLLTTKRSSSTIGLTAAVCVLAIVTGPTGIAYATGIAEPTYTTSLATTVPDPPFGVASPETRLRMVQIDAQLRGARTAGPQVF